MRAAVPILALLALTGGFLRAQDAPAGRATLDLSPREVTVGDRIQATLAVELPAGARLEPPPDLGSAFGPLAVASGSWEGPSPVAQGVRFTWRGTLSAYATGAVTIPALSIPFTGPAGPGVARTEPATLTVRSVLEPAAAADKDAKQPEIQDLKPPVSVAPNYGPLRKALWALLALAAVSGLAWWVHRRYAARLAAVPTPTDPFRRMPPHVWAYQELQRLLDQRLAEEGRVDEFFEELSRILKLYLGGRYRVDLMEQTTGEILPLLRQAGAPQGPLLEARALLERSDLVKFAREAPPPEACRRAVEEAYRIVDATKPVEEAPAQAAARGAA